MGARIHGSVVIALLALPLLTTSARPQNGVAVSSPTAVAASSGTILTDSNAIVATSSVAVVAASTAPANAPGSAQIGSAGSDTIPAIDAEKSLQTAAVQAMLDMAAAYSEKRRTLFMRLVSDDFLGDLGTLEDALSSDFRSYRTIVLSVVPGFVTVNAAQASVQFHYDMTITNDVGNSNKFSGDAAYVFRREDDGKVRLYKMDSGAQIFGTSLPSTENPVAKSQGAQTGGAATSPTPCSASTVSGTVTVTYNSTGFKFANQSLVSPGSSDVFIVTPGANPTVDVNPGAGIADLGPCSFNTFSQDPSSINGASGELNVGDCYAVRTAADKYAVLLITGFNPGGGDGPPPGTMTFNYKYQPNGQTCF